MDRRGFLKLSTLFAAYAVVNSKLDVVEKIANAFDRSQKVLIYLLQDTKGNWSVKATKNFENSKTLLKEKKWNLDTFKVLEYTDEIDADSKKKYWWDYYKCKGQYVPYNLRTILDNSKKGLAKLKESGFYRSDNFYNSFIKSGAPAYMNKLRAEKGDQAVKNHMIYISKFITPAGKLKAIEVFLQGGLKYSQSERGKKNCAKMGKEWGARNGTPSLKSFSPEKKFEYSRSGGLAGGAKKAIERGTHNFLKCSPNKIKVICPDGHITSKPSAVVYCKNRGLNYDDCKILKTFHETN